MSAWKAIPGAEDRTDPDEQTWTISRGDRPGWCTDGGYDGYGLTKAEAEFLATAANEKEARDGKPGPWEELRNRS